MEESGLFLKKEKCLFMASSVTSLVHVIGTEGLCPIAENVDAITYYNCFLPNLSTVLFPLYRLLRKKTQWSWSNKKEAAFKASKELLTSSNLLVHFDPSLELILVESEPY